MTHDSRDLYPADIARIARTLDDLGEAERQAAGAEFESSVIGAIEAARRPAPLRLATGAGAGPRRGSRLGWGAGLGAGGLRLAATIAIVAGGLAAWMALRPAPAPVGELVTADRSLEQEVDAWLSLAGPDDELRAEIEIMLLQSADLARGLDAGWIEDDLLGESL